MKLVAWGLRNPYGLTFSEDGKKLYVANNGADERGSRPITNDTDKIYQIDPLQHAKFYGWPDFFGNAESVTSGKFQSNKANETLTPLIMNPPPVEKPIAQNPHIGAGSTQAVFINSTNDTFGMAGKLLVGQVGSFAPLTHKVRAADPMVSAVDPSNGNYTSFVSTKKLDPSFRPIGLAFNAKENTLYLVSFAKIEMRTTTPHGDKLPMPTPWPYENTGVIWKITHTPTAGTTAISSVQSRQNGATAPSSISNSSNP